MSIPSPNFKTTFKLPNLTNCISQRKNSTSHQCNPESSSLNLKVDPIDLLDTFTVPSLTPLPSSSTDITTGHRIHKPNPCFSSFIALQHLNNKPRFFFWPIQVLANIRWPTPSQNHAYLIITFFLFQSFSIREEHLVHKSSFILQTSSLWRRLQFNECFVLLHLITFCRFVSFF